MKSKPPSSSPEGERKTIRMASPPLGEAGRGPLFFIYPLFGGYNL
jgi:hypothetical protein